MISALIAWNEARFMDKKEPGWAGTVDPSRLRIESVLGCVLGQTHGYFTTGLRELGLSHFQAAWYGFIAGIPFVTYKGLDKAWKKQIRARRLKRTRSFTLAA